MIPISDLKVLFSPSPCVLLFNITKPNTINIFAFRRGIRKTAFEINDHKSIDKLRQDVRGLIKSAKFDEIDN